MLSLSGAISLVKAQRKCVSAVSELQHDVNQDAFARFFFMFFNLWNLS